MTEATKTTEQAEAADTSVRIDSETRGLLRRMQGQAMAAGLDQPTMAALIREAVSVLWEAQEAKP